MSSASLPLAACSCCGLIQHIPTAPAGRPVRCARCHTRVGRGGRRRSNRRTAALALAALALYPVAISLPIMHVEQFGLTQEASVWSGGVALLTDGQYAVGGIVLLCSVVLPAAKLMALFLLAGGGVGLRPRLRARAWHFVEMTGRWGMLDVLLVAILVAVLKLGDLMDLSAGPGAIAFTACVLLNLAASASFDPHDLWEDPS